MKIVLNSRTVDTIPILEYYQEDRIYKSLVFVQHGYESTKEYGSDFLAIQLARMGYFVVAIDADKHGERIAEPYLTGTEKERLDEAFVVIKKTALDIRRIHHILYEKQFPTFDMIGISLGGMVAYYLATKTTKLKTLIPVISTPDFLPLAMYTVKMSGFDVESYFTPDKLAFIKSINPMNRLKDMTYETLHIFVGTKDPIVPYQASKAYFEEYGTNQDSYHEYDVDHTVPRQMQLDIFHTLETIYQ
jgi:esterase/lipase